MIDIPSKRAITDSEVLAEVVDCLGEQIQIDTEGAFNQTDLFNILVRAAANSDTIENTAKTLKQSPSGQAIRYHLQKFNDFKQLEFQLNQLLKSRLPKGIIKGHHSLAIDLNLIPYYGKPSEIEAQYIYRSQAKAGTCSFYAYATLYVIKKGKRLTLAIRGVRCFDTSCALITYLLSEISCLEIKIKKLYLDRGFFSISVIRCLQALDIPFIMPAIRRGKRGGIKQFLKGRKSYKTTYTMRKGQDKVTFDLWILCKYHKGERKKHGIKYFAYVVHRVKTSLIAIFINLIAKDSALKAVIDSKIFAASERLIKNQSLDYYL